MDISISIGIPPTDSIFGTGGGGGPTNFELREDGSLELREDGGDELRQ